MLVLSAMALMMVLSQRFLQQDATGVALRSWRRRLIFGELLQGSSWALVVQVLLAGESPGIRSFVLFLPMMLTAVTAILSSTTISA